MFLIGFILIISCSKKNEDITPVYQILATPSKPILRFAVHPLHNPKLLMAKFEPLISYLDKNIPEYEFRLEASTNYASFEEKLKSREVEFALPNPYQSLMAIQHGYHIFAKMGDDENFRGIILVRKDSGIKRVADLKGKTISYPAPSALAASMLPQYFFYKNGLNVLKDTKSIYAGSQESSIMNVFLKVSKAGCTWPPPWKAFLQSNPDKAQELEVKWVTNVLPNNSFIARNDVPRDLVLKIHNLLLELHKTREGKIILDSIGLSQFETADEKTYEPVKNFLAKFTKDIRQPDQEK
jgi:phosphonate transport system substrate-binding protein